MKAIQGGRPYLVIQCDRAEILHSIQVHVSGAQVAPFRVTGWISRHTSVSTDSCIALANCSGHEQVGESKATGHHTTSAHSLQSIIPFQGEPGLNVNPIIMARMGVRDGDIAKVDTIHRNGRMIIVVCLGDVRAVIAD